MSHDPQQSSGSGWNAGSAFGPIGKASATHQSSGFLADDSPLIEEKFLRISQSVQLAGPMMFDQLTKNEQEKMLSVIRAHVELMILDIAKDLFGCATSIPKTWLVSNRLNLSSMTTREYYAQQGPLGILRLDQCV